MLKNYERNSANYAHGARGLDLERTKISTNGKLEHSMTRHILDDESSFIGFFLVNLPTVNLVSPI